MIGKCQGCAFWDANDRPAGKSKCVRFPPVPGLQKGQGNEYEQIALQPWTAADDSCGEYQPIGELKGPNQVRGIDPERSELTGRDLTE